MRPIHALSEAAAADLEWAQPAGRLSALISRPARGRDELRAGDEVVAILSYDLRYRSADAEAAEGCWEFRLSHSWLNMFGPQYEIRNPMSPTGEEVATFRPEPAAAGFAGARLRGVLDCAGGRSFRRSERSGGDAQRSDELSGGLGRTWLSAWLGSVHAGEWHLDSAQGPLGEALWWSRPVAGRPVLPFWSNGPRRWKLHIAVSPAGIATPELSLVVLFDRFLTRMAEHDSDAPAYPLS